MSESPMYTDGAELSNSAQIQQAEQANGYPGVGSVREPGTTAAVIGGFALFLLLTIFANPLGLLAPIFGGLAIYRARDLPVGNPYRTFARISGWISVWAFIPIVIALTLIASGLIALRIFGS